MSQPTVHIVITKSEKKPALGAVLGFFFGPIGLLYSTISGAIVMGIATVISAICIPLLFGLGIPMVFGCWIASAIWGYMACKKHNDSINAAVINSSSNNSKAA